MDSISNLILAIGLMLVMWGMGLSLVVDDFKRVVRYPKAMVIGLVSQLVLLPLIGYALVLLMNVPAEIAVGVMILAACPGGATSNLITHLSRADAALSVSLTAVTSVITVVTIPLIVNFAMESFLDQSEMIRLDFLETIVKISMIVLIPVALGMTVRHFWPHVANKLGKTVRIASAAILILIIVGVVIKEKDVLPGYFVDAGIVSLLLNITTILVGFFLGRVFSLSPQQSTSISIESGMQNGTLALAVAGGLLNNAAFAIAPAVYSIIMFFTAGMIIYWGVNNLPAPKTEI
ncbi:bile acid:sodium symporter family protein [Membranicola marinus]|uniref:Bile acid:sodium symporter family protein n=1 Tax=Membranihabitans marinus TaxID=1227546 RepID=A0A953HMR8_9BACT|nr:bile acid:sodium symporter family protein [Membranihabitans marinus]MBY5958839.1 bile acid:sodium symporter family protein [Membranihabitans marinus]